MGTAEAVSAFAYVLYVASSAFKDELWLRVILAASSVGFIVWGVLEDSWVIIFFNAVFVAISTFHIIRLIRQRQPVELSPAERAVREKLFPTLSARQFLLFFHMGTRVEITGRVTEQGESVDDLLLLLEGEVNVLRDGARIATVRPASFVGEMSYISGQPASATLEVEGTATAQRWSQAEMSAIEVAEPELSHALRAGIARDLVSKVHK